MKNTRLYLDNWSYNAAIILQELETIILNNGGAIVSTWKTGERDTVTITNRTLDKAIREKKELIERLEAHGRNADTQKKELEEMESIKNDPITLHYGEWHYISFTIGNDYYYYSMDRNPFFDFHYGKRPIIEGTVSPDYYMDSDSKKWLYDCFFTFQCSQADRREAANLIYNMLLKAPYSSKYRGNRKPGKLTVLEGEKTW